MDKELTADKKVSANPPSNVYFNASTPLMAYTSNQDKDLAVRHFPTALICVVFHTDDIVSDDSILIPTQLVGVAGSSPAWC